MPEVWVPPLLQPFTGGRSQIRVAGRTLRQVIVALERDYPGLQGRLRQDGDIMPGIAVVVDGEMIGEGILTPVREESEVHFLPALGGGCNPPIVSV